MDGGSTMWSSTLTRTRSSRRTTCSCSAGIRPAAAVWHRSQLPDNAPPRSDADAELLHQHLPSSEVRGTPAREVDEVGRQPGGLLGGLRAECRQVLLDGVDRA